MDGSATRVRQPLSRTFSRGRWPEYRRFLLSARSHGYRTVPLEEWVRDGEGSEEPTLILRHDIDQHPRSALTMERIERELGVRSSWYFRWRTAHPAVIGALRESGLEVGLHYETLTRKALERGIEGPVDEQMLAEGRSKLREEIAAFARLFGPIRSAVPHGDSRVPGVRNSELLRGENCADYGIEFDGNEAMRGRGIAYWLTDRTSAEGRWKDGVDPVELFAQRETPILCLTHPNNWASGPSLWQDRVMRGVLRSPRRSTAGGWEADSHGLRSAPRMSDHDFTAIADSLRREVRGFYRERGEELSDPAGLNTLETNSGFVERRSQPLLEILYGVSGLESIAGLRVLDLGCGFGAVAAYLAAQGAEVTGVDPNEERFLVGRAVVAEHELPVEFKKGQMQKLELPDRSFDLAIQNNSLCYVIPRDERRDALSESLRVLRPGGFLVVRNPNRWNPLDQFTGLPLIQLLPPRQAVGAAKRLGKERSTVRLTSPREAVSEIRGAGFEDVRHVPSPERARPGFMRPFARYQHLVGRRPR